MRNGKLSARQTREARAMQKMNTASHAGPGAKSADFPALASSVSAGASNVPAKWRWHWRVLLSLRDRLLRQRGELLHSAAESLEPHSLDEADSATDEFDHSLALAQLSAEQDALYEADAALHRIADGSYGICEESGEPITAARLRAIPWTRFTREVEERLEARGAVGRARLGGAATVRESGQTLFGLEEVPEESTETTANDESLSQVFPPPGPGAGPQKNEKRQRPATKRRERSK
jgi:DnaK suppressor protein